MKLALHFFRHKTVALSALILIFYFDSCCGIDHYEKLINSYCNYYKISAKLNDNELKEYKTHFMQQCTYGGYAFYCLYNNAIKTLKIDSPEKKISTLCKLICFFYLQGLTENTDPEKNGLYEVDFHIYDPKKSMYKIFVENYCKKASKEFVYQYEAEFLQKKVSFYEFLVKNIVEKKPLLPLGHNYIRIYHDSDNKKLHIRTMPHSYHSFSNGMSSIYKTYIEDARNKPGYKKIHVLDEIQKAYNTYFYQNNKPQFLYKIFQTIENNQNDHEYETELNELIKTINKKYRYPKKMYGNEVYIDSRDLLAMKSYLDYLKITKKNNEETEQLAALIKPFLVLDTIIFDYNNFQKYTLEDKLYAETEALRLYVKEVIIPHKEYLEKFPSPYRSYVNELITILELIMATKTPDAHLLYGRIFDSEEHKKIKKKLETTKQKNQSYAEVLKNIDNNDDKIEENFQELKLELNNRNENDTESLQSCENDTDD